MNREVLVKLTKEQLIDLALMQAKQIEVLTVRVAELEAKLGLPPKTPDNSSKPPSQGQKANGDGMRRSKNKAHPGAHRPLHANPTRKRDVAAEHCQHCRADQGFSTLLSDCQAEQIIDPSESRPVAVLVEGVGLIDA